MLRRVRRAAAAVTAAWLLGSWGWAEPGEAPGRQAVIDHIVAASARVALERAGTTSSGSGVVIASGRDAAGIEVSYLLTAAHVVDAAGPAEILVRFTGDAGGRDFPARLLRRSAEGLDLALLKITGLAAPAVDLEQEAEPRLGEEVLIVGFPWGKRLGLYSGVVSQVPLAAGEEAAGGDDAAPSLTVDAAVVKGVSGGGVFRLHTGGLVGIVEASQTTTVSVRGKSESYTVTVPVPGDACVVPLSGIRAFLRQAGPELSALHSQR
jgi:hypothetical protein